MSSISKADNSKNPDERDPIIIAVVGAKRQGKSTVIDSFIKDYMKANASGKVLIHDLSETRAFAEYAEIGVDDLKKGILIDGHRKKWDRGVHRTITKDTDTLIKNINSHFRNGLVVLDEARSWIPRGDASVNMQIMELFTTHTNKNLDIIVVFHEWMDISTKLRGMINDWIIFRTGVEPTGEKWFASRFFPAAKVLNDCYHNVVQLGQKKDRQIQHYAYVMRDAGEVAVDYPMLQTYPEDAIKIGIEVSATKLQKARQIAKKATATRKPAPKKSNSKENQKNYATRTIRK